MTIEIDSRHLKSPAGIAVAVLVAALALGYLSWRRGQLVEQGTAQVEEYLAAELPARYSRQMLDEGRGREVDPSRLAALGQVEVVEFSPGWLFRKDRDDRVRVRTVVSVGTGERETFHFEFRSNLGGWRLVRETAEPLLDRLF